MKKQEETDNNRKKMEATGGQTEQTNNYVAGRTPSLRVHTATLTYRLISTSQTEVNDRLAQYNFIYTNVQTTGASQWNLTCITVKPLELVPDRYKANGRGDEQRARQNDEGP